MGSCCGSSDSSKVKQPSSSNIEQSKTHSFIRKPIDLGFKDGIRKNYKILGIIGNGNLGKIYKAQDKNNPSITRVIKIIPRTRLIQRQIVIDDEIIAIKNLSHPNIIKYFETFEDSKYFSFVMEYASGPDVLQALLARGSYNEGTVQKIGNMLLEALKEAHTNLILHRDLKLDKIFFSSPDTEELKLVDFGMGRQNIGNNFITYASSPYFVGPEILGGKPYTEKSDIWSVGVILYILLCGEFPHSGNNSSQVTSCIMTQKPSYSEKGWAIISNQGRNLVQNLLAHDPDKRYTANMALNHPWFKAGNLLQSKPNILENALIAKSLKNIVWKHITKNEIIGILQGYVDEEVIVALRGSIRTLDTSNDGRIPLVNFQKSLEDQRLLNSAKDLIEIQRKMQIMGDELINYTELFAKLIQNHTFNVDERLWEIFKHFEQDNKGTIPARIAKHILSVGLKRDQDDFDENIKNYNINKDGNITYEELRIISFSYNFTPREETIEQLVNNPY